MVCYMIVDQNKENYDMAKRIAQFEKVSFVQFKEGYKDAFGDVSDEEIREIYEKIKLPRRATAGSAGYDFFMPVTKTLKVQETLKVPTGIRVKMDENWVLMLSEKWSWIQIPSAA